MYVCTTRHLDSTPVKLSEGLSSVSKPVVCSRWHFLFHNWHLPTGNLFLYCNACFYLRMLCSQQYLPHLPSPSPLLSLLSSSTDYWEMLSSVFGKSRMPSGGRSDDVTLTMTSQHYLTLSIYSLRTNTTYTTKRPRKIPLRGVTRTQDWKVLKLPWCHPYLPLHSL